MAQPQPKRGFAGPAERMVLESRPVPLLPGNDPYPFGFPLPEVLRFQSDYNVAVLEKYQAAFYDFFWNYDFTGALQVPALGTQSISKRIQNDCFFGLMFLIVQFSYTDTVRNAFTLQLSDSSRNIQYFDFPVHCDLIAGTATMPFWLPNMILLNPNSNLNITVVDLSGVDNDIRILAGGRNYKK